MWQRIIVAFLVAASVLFAAWTLSPQPIKLRLLDRFDALLPTGGLGAWLRAHLLAPLRARAAPAGGCSNCAPGAAAPGRSRRE